MLIGCVFVTVCMCVCMCCLFKCFASFSNWNILLNSRIFLFYPQVLYYFYVYFQFLLETVSLSSTDWPGTYDIDHAGLEL